MASSVPWARNLKKNQLGGVVFGCTKDTLKECHSNQLFGLPGNHFSYVKNIEPGLPLFLFNYSDRKLYGIYEAVSSGKMNIDSYAWTAGGIDRTKYPAQVQVRMRLRCQALTEVLFKPFIIDNYYSQAHFWFELDHTQASKLISKLSSLAIAPGTLVPKSIPKRTTETQWFSSDNKGKKSEKLTDDSAKSHGSVGTVASSNGRNELVESPTCEKTVEIDEVNLVLKKLKELAVSREYVEAESKDDVDLEEDTGDNTIMALGKVKGENSLETKNYPTIIAQLHYELEELKSFNQEQTHKMKSLETKLSEAEQEIDQLKNRCMMLESLSNPNTTLAAEEFLSNPSATLVADEDSLSNSKSILVADEVSLLNSNTTRVTDEETLFDSSSTLKTDSEFLSNPNTALVAHEESLSNHNVTHIADEESLSNSNTKLVYENEYLSDLNTTLVADEESPEEFHLNLNKSIFIVGGYDGISWSSALKSFSPSDDVLRSLKHMSCARSHASVADLNGDLYVFGGVCGFTWYDTVEVYNVENNQWTILPRMNKKMGSLGGAALNGKIFAVGGGNGVECFSDVETFDLDVGRWITGPSMLQKRFALAAVELNGALYSVGGFDGENYLETAERFDPREHSWTRIESMNIKRGCHSLVVMNEKIYAIGGYDGKTMVPSVEIYEPRVGTWVIGEPMNQGRGYLSAAVLNESIYVLGGVKPDEQIIEDMIECYKEGEGWQATNLRAPGKRCCFASAIVLEGDRV